MRCVEQYFHSLIENAMDELEEELISAVIAAPRDGPMQNFVAFDALDLTALMLFSRDGRHDSPRYISYMTALGLDFMYSVVVSGKSKHWKMIRSNHPVSRDFLPQAFGYTSREISEPGCSTTIPTVIQLDDDNPLHSNLGCRLFGKIPQSTNYIGLANSDSISPLLWQIGYVFWDSVNVQSPGVFEKLSAAKAMKWDELHLRINRNRKNECAEVRLKGTRVPREQLRRLEKEFGSTLLCDDDD
ncbi:hypothetical protein BGZ63DRAFT_457596 [Mariannaea sp. PMI_226]|nr:hypothetical protein BGZ63DRAFT_457596 [Mariannaea sp. PMI_226]